MPRRIRRSRNLASILYIIAGVLILIRPDIAISLLAIFLIVIGALGLLEG